MIEQKSGYMPLMRGDLERTLADILPKNIKIRFATTIAEVSDHADNVEVKFADGSVETFDNLIIAEGIHSATRALVFGPEERFFRPLDSMVAIARLKGGGHALNGIAQTNINVGSFAIATPTTDGDVISVFAFLSDKNRHVTKLQQKQCCGPTIQKTISSHSIISARSRQNPTCSLIRLLKSITLTGAKDELHSLAVRHHV